MGESGRYRQAIFIPYSSAYICYNDADARRGFIHDLETARSYGREDDAGLRQNHQSQEGRGGEPCKWIVRLMRYRARFGKRFTLLRGAYRRKRK